MHFVGSRGRWRPQLSFVFASCPSFAPGQGRELSHSAAPPLPRSAECTSWVPGADGGWSCASFSQAAHLSLPAKAESSVIPLLLLSHEVQNALRGFPGPMEVGAELRFRKLPIFCSRPRPRAQSFRCSSSPTKCRMHFVGSWGRWRPAAYTPPKLSQSLSRP